MNLTSRISATLGYIPLLGWLYVLIARRNDDLAVFHVRQSIAMVVGLVMIAAGWAVVAWLLAWIPYGDIFGIALFGLVIVALIVAVIDAVIGMVNALLGHRKSALFFGGIANRLPF